MHNLNKRWRHIRSKAQSKDDFDRMTALATAVGSLEVAMTAVGIPNHAGFLRRVNRSGFAGSKGWPNPHILEAAATARNRAVHAHAVVKREHCTDLIRALYKSWCYLRRRFVNRRNAASLAKTLLESEGKFFTLAFLFGSLARSRREPKDIDLLLLDNGDVSSIAMATGYGMTDMVLSAAGISNRNYDSAVKCGWLDIVVIDGSRFGKEDRAYTQSIAKIQTDPLFFVNISDELLMYDAAKNNWTKNRPQCFERLAILRKQLENEGIVRPRRNTRL